MTHEDPADIAAARRWFAEDLRLRAPIRRNPAIVEAFAAVPRERFLGEPPWRIIPDVLPRMPVAAPDQSARWVYHDVLVAIDPAKNLNNGMPSLWARIFDHLALRPGGRVLQVGAGTGYYTAVLAEIVGTDGRVTAVEIDDELASRARANLAPWPQVEVVAGDGRTHDPGEVDTVIVCAGATHPAPRWLDRLAPGGELMLPLTADNWWGFLLRATRSRDHDEPGLIVLPQRAQRKPPSRQARSAGSASFRARAGATRPRRNGCASRSKRFRRAHSTATSRSRRCIAAIRMPTRWIASGTTGRDFGWNAKWANSA